jgi:hypothetical protein
MDAAPEQVHELIASWDSIKRFVCDNSEAVLEELDAVLFQDTERQSVDPLKNRAA